MKSLRRGSTLMTVMIVFFMIGMCILIYKLLSESPMYISHSPDAELGLIYDRNGDVLYDKRAKDGDYPAQHFKDVGNLIGDTSGQMTNTLVSKNIEKLSNYSFMAGIDKKDGKAAIYTTLDHSVNEKVYSSFGDKDGTAIAYNYETGEILVCVSRPNIDPLHYLEDVEGLPSGSLLCKAFSKTVPGSTQKVATTLAADQIMGMDLLSQKSYSCTGGIYDNDNDDPDDDIICWKHDYGGEHGTQDIREAFKNSCNPFFAQLVRDPDWSIGDIEKCYKDMWISVNGSEENRFSVDGIVSDAASTTLDNKNDFSTQWGCIGQGETMVSPCVMMMWESAIANGTGKATMPHLIGHVTNVSGRTVERAETSFSDRLFSQQSARDIRDIMLENGESNPDHNYNSAFGCTVGIKSGTAQVGDKGQINSLLTGFVEDGGQPIAFSVVVEDGSSDDSINVVRTILENLNE